MWLGKNTLEDGQVVAELVEKLSAAFALEEKLVPIDLENIDDQLVQRFKLPLLTNRASRCHK